jgi:hypothetical protein
MRLQGLHRHLAVILGLHDPRGHVDPRSEDKHTWIEGHAHLDRGTCAWRDVIRGLGSRDTRGSFDRSPLGRHRCVVLHGRMRALVPRDTRGSLHLSADFARGTSARRRWKCGDRWIDPHTCMDASSLGTERSAGIDRSKCTDRSTDPRATIEPSAQGHRQGAITIGQRGSTWRFRCGGGHWGRGHCASAWRRARRRETHRVAAVRVVREFMYGTSALGNVTDPSAFWWFSRRGMRMRGLAIAVLFSVKG